MYNKTHIIMKKSELKAYIKESIIETLSEEEQIPDAKEVEATTKALADLNNELARSKELQKEEEDDDKDAIKQAKAARGKNKKYDIVLNDFKKVETEMRSLARDYSKADGVEKDNILKKLKDLTNKKNELKQEVEK